MLVGTEEAVGRVEAKLRERVAPWPHTVLLVGVLVSWAVFGALRVKLGIVSDAPLWIRYSGQVVLLWLMTGTAVAGLYHRRRFVRSMFGGVDPGRDLKMGTLIFVAGVAMMAILGIALRPLHLTHLRQVVAALAPRTGPELALWMVVSASAGICEEFLFRGYLLRQVLSWSGSRWFAVLATSVLFAGMHLYEGTAAAVQIGALGALLGTVAFASGTLRQVMIAHFLQDAVAGLMMYLRHHS